MQSDQSSQESMKMMTPAMSPKMKIIGAIDFPLKFSTNLQFRQIKNISQKYELHERSENQSKV
jgi:hypothetical protein